MNYFSIQLGISSSQLTNSYFSEGQVYHQPDYIECIDDVGTLGWSRLLYAMGHWSTSQHSWTSTLISLDPVPIKEPSKTGSDSGLTCSIFCPYCLYCNYCCYCFNNKVFKLLIPEFAVSREGIHLWDRRRIYGYKLYIYIIYNTGQVEIYTQNSEAPYVYIYIYPWLQYIMRTYRHKHIHLQTRQPAYLPNLPTFPHTSDMILVTMGC